MLLIITENTYYHYLKNDNIFKKGRISR